MTIEYFPDIVQGTDEWFEARRGLLTASEMKRIITPAKLQYASNDKERSHVYEIAAQRITGFVEAGYLGDDMIRGHEEEVLCTAAYAAKYGEVQKMGFITNDKWGFKIGYSTDGLVNADGQIENKSRCQKYQIETIIDNAMPADFLIQVQTGLLVTERSWCDFNSYCGGMPMFTIRIYPDQRVQEAIIAAAQTFEDRVKMMIDKYNMHLAMPGGRYIPTERVKMAGNMIVGDTDE